MLPYEPEAPLSLAGTDVQIAAGEGDPFSSPEQIRRLAEILRGGGATVSPAHRARGRTQTDPETTLPDRAAGWPRVIGTSSDARPPATRRGQVER